MHLFHDVHGAQVKLSFLNHPFAQRPNHVWVICRKEGQWLLTRHRQRGLEFPGGKVEPGESAEQAARREVYEETGASVATLEYIGQYKVSTANEAFVKSIYFATIEQLVEQVSYFETEGPVLLEQLPGKLSEAKDFSFIMKDDVLLHCLDYLEENKRITPR